ncbi:MAG: hypothetical protein QOE96_3033 [Blastocatellia bacterium]|jgi:4-hydroxy-3-methylbut-2-enyl diphosphate reductase IspH|nr:hypothetical protein [Blastocatellia bacterium]
MYVTDIEEMHSKPGRYRVVYQNQTTDSVPTSGPKHIWKADLSEQEAKQEEIICYRTLNEL